MEDLKFMKLTIGEKFRRLRAQARNSEDEVAAHLKVSLPTYIKMEEDFVYPSDQQIAKLGQLYDMTYQQVLDVGETE